MWWLYFRYVVYLLETLSSSCLVDIPTFVKLTAYLNRLSSHAAISWKKSGEALENVYIQASDEQAQDRR
jgi:hypothetical protein